MSGKALSAIEENPPSSVTRFPWAFEAEAKYRELYQDITRNGVTLQYQDRHALGELATMMVEAEYLRADLVERGEAMEVQGDRNMVTKKNPARDALEKLRTPMLRLMKEFKLTPSSRKTTFGASPGGTKQDDEFDNF